MSIKPTWRLALCGINHKTSSTDEREPLQIGHDRIAEAHAELYRLDGVLEATIVPTCNRIEFYIVVERQFEIFDIIKSFYKEFNDLDISNLNEKFYIKKGKHVADHIFAVTSGLDSMVIGEDQIVGQVKDAYSSACRVKTAGKIMHRLFHQAFRAGKQVRSETNIAKGPCSVSAAAVGLVKSMLKTEDRPVVLFIGVNKMIELAASILDKTHHDKFIFANRTPENLKELAVKYNAEAYSLDKLPELIGKSDILFSCTGSEMPIITQDLIDGVKHNKKIICVDLAVPRDIEFNTGYKPDLFVYRLDDIQQFIKDRQEKQKLAIPEAEEIIGKLQSEFKYWYNHILYEPIYNGLEKTFEIIRDDELAGIIDELPDKYKKKVCKATNRMISKMLQAKVNGSQKDGKG